MSTHTRRSMLQQLSLGVALAGSGKLFAPKTARAQTTPRKFLFVMGATGGASIIDSFLPIARSASANASTLVTHADEDIAVVGNLRCVAPVVQPRLFNAFPIDPHLQPFLTRHGADLAVITQESSSVNHAIAQKRSMTGNGIHQGRTILEAAAIVHGQGLVLPAVNMTEQGFLDQGDDFTVPDSARAVGVADALRFALAMDGHKGLLNVPSKDLVNHARRIRTELDDNTAFGRTFGAAPLRQGFVSKRDVLTPQLEALDTISKLTMLRDAPSTVPLAAYGLTSSVDEPLLRAQFPELTTDPLQAQAALAFLLVKNGLSCAVAMSPSFTPYLQRNPGPPIAYDFSHTDHKKTQQAMWSRIMRVIDGLIVLLKATPVDANDASQGTFWDHSMVYVATDFGRDKIRPADSEDFGTGHHLNNGNVLISPLVRGDRVYGGVDNDTGLTYGFDRSTGEPLPGTLMDEGDVYSAVAHALGIDFNGRRDMPALVRA
jgi:hypothetical protein